jgi:uncharacterized repeat protein (TIGR02543 family)
MAPVLTGSGTVFITIDLPAGHNITAAKVYKDGTEITPSPAAEVNGDRVVFAQSCDAGAYFFSVHLFAANGDLYGVALELAQVRANLTSAISQTLTLEDLNRKYGIIYHLNGGAFDPGAGVDNPGYYRSVDAAFTLPEPNRTGYAFGGWYGSNDVSTGGVVAGIAQGSMEDKEYWAKWTPVTYTITYALNNGTNAEQNPAAYTIETPAITLADPSRSGYDFQGWYTEAEFTNPATEIPLGSAGDKTFYARWTPVAYAITYILNDGTNAEQNPAAYTIESAAITFAAPTRTGYAFGGWYDNAAFSNSAVTGISAGSMGDKTFYAQWTAITYTVQYDANGGSGTTYPSSHVYGTAKNLTANDFSRTGYSFAGWSDGGGTIYADGESVSNLSSTQGAVVTLYAQWKQSVSVAISVWVNEDGNILVSNADVTISRSGSGWAAGFSAEVTGAYSGIQWYLYGDPVSGSRGTARSIAINAADYADGSYYLGVTVTKEGVPYSTDIHFMVIN